MQYGIVTISHKNLLSRIIQFFTGSKWDHTAFYIKRFFMDGVEKKDTIVEINLGGVQLHSLETYKKDKDIVIHKNTPEINLGKALGFIVRNRNKRYDFLRTLFFFYRPKGVNSKESWNCIEFIEELFKDQGIELFEGKKLTPGQINKKLSSKDDIIIRNK